jgi:predicted HicB family RNase H-like nuclease
MAFDQTAYKAEYNRQAYDQITLRVRKGERKEIAKAAAERGMSINKYILSLIESDKKEEP